jgi:Rrf2 family nitric oxide-sensitive transcriptional repressor
MRLNLQSDYALRMLMQLAVSPGRLVTVAEVSERYGISKNHLMKVAHLLGREGFVETVRGRSGGLRLARSPEKITVGEVVRRMESDLAIVECFPGGSGACLIAPGCRLKGVLHTALEAFLSVLDQTTLADLTRKNPGLQSLLGVAA